MIQKEKWRETIDPFSLPYRKFKLTEILGYAHAGNDVFYAKGIYKEECIKVFIKVEKQEGADIVNEVKILKQLPVQNIPQVIEYGIGNINYIITKEAIGERLSTIVNENKNFESIRYMETYGETLANFHMLNIEADPVKDRRFFNLPSHEYFEKYELESLEEYLLKHQPNHTNTCFVHGDFHYANILWKHNNISCILDYELSGYGIKEFDIAWAIFLRPSQKFLKTTKEINCFLEGYLKIQDFNRTAFKYYYILIASYFYSMGDVQYRKSVLHLVHELICGM